MELADRVMSLKGKTYYTEISRLSGVPAATISKIARGVILDPPVFVTKAIANAFDMTLEELIRPFETHIRKNVISSSMNNGLRMTLERV